MPPTSPPTAPSPPVAHASAARGGHRPTTAQGGWPADGTLSLRITPLGYVGWGLGWGGSARVGCKRKSTQHEDTQPPTQVLLPPLFIIRSLTFSGFLFSSCRAFRGFDCRSRWHSHTTHASGKKTNIHPGSEEVAAAVLEIRLCARSPTVSNISCLAREATGPAATSGATGTAATTDFGDFLKPEPAA